MICAFLFHGEDVSRTQNLLRWIAQLGGCKGHDALLVADYATPYSACSKAKRLAERSFSNVRTISNGATVKGWPQGPNSLFWAAAAFVHGAWPKPFLIMESDAVPLRQDWLTSLENEYLDILAPFMGDIYTGLNSSTSEPVRAVSGIAVYPADANGRLQRTDKEAWDMGNRQYLLEHTHATGQIKHFYGELKLPPTFVEQKDPHSPVNSFTLDQIRKEAVLWHRCKDGSLIRLLRKRAGIVPDEHPVIVVFPVHNGDAQLLELNFQWMAEIDGQSPFDAILAFDPTLKTKSRDRLMGLGRIAFPKLQQFVFPKPKHLGWPMAPNHSFQSCAKHLRNFNRPWLWMEADAWPTRTGWLEILEDEYLGAGKEVMGPVVPGMGHHVNGCAIYPFNFCDISPRAMKATTSAWDAACRPDLEGKIHDAANLMQHIWGIDKNGFTPWGGTGSPTFPTPERLAWINPSAVMVHRVKDGTLIHWLRLRRK